MFGIYRETLTCTNMKNHVDYFPVVFGDSRAASQALV